MKQLIIKHSKIGNPLYYIVDESGKSSRISRYNLQKAISKGKIELKINNYSVHASFTNRSDVEKSFPTEEDAIKFMKELVADDNLYVINVYVSYQGLDYHFDDRIFSVDAPNSVFYNSEDKDILSVLVGNTNNSTKVDTQREQAVDLVARILTADNVSNTTKKVIFGKFARHIRKRPYLADIADQIDRILDNGLFSFTFDDYNALSA